jgi:hypothetical protein
MGFIWRTLAPRPVKKARRLISPTQVVADAVQPRAVKRARRVVYRTVNPLEGVEGLAGDAVVKGRRRPKPKRSSTRGTSRARSSRPPRPQAEGEHSLVVRFLSWVILASLVLLPCLLLGLIVWGIVALS